MLCVNMVLIFNMVAIVTMFPKSLNIENESDYDSNINMIQTSLRKKTRGCVALMIGRRIKLD